MNKLICSIIAVFFAGLAPALGKLVPNCPFKLSPQEIKIIEENYKNFLQTAKKQVDIIGSSAAKRYDLRCTDLANLNLSNRTFKYIDFCGANLDESDFTVNKFEYVDLTKTSLKKIRANRAQFWDCILDEADFSGAIIPTITLLGTKEPFSAKKTNFTNADIAGTAQFKNVDARGAIFDGASFDSGGLQYIKISPETSFKKTNFTGASLNDFKGQPGSLRSWLLDQKANLTNAYINGVYTGIPANL